MCFLCLQDFIFEIPETKDLEIKKKNLKTIKNLNNLISLASELQIEMCQSKINDVKNKMYKLSREF